MKRELLLRNCLIHLMLISLLISHEARLQEVINPFSTKPIFGRKKRGIFIATLVLFYIYIPWPFPPVWGVADNTKRKQKQWGFYSVLLATTRDPAEFGWHCCSNSPSSPIFHNLCRFIIYDVSKLGTNSSCSLKGRIKINAHRNDHHKEKKMRVCYRRTRQTN